MANALIQSLRPTDFLPASSGNPAGSAKDLGGLGVTNLGSGLAFCPQLSLPFPANVGAAYAALWVPAVAGLATGITTELLVVDDLNNPGPGLLATFDVTFALVVSGTTLELDASFTTGTADSVQITMPTGSTGKLKSAVITSVLAHMVGTVAVNSWLLVRLRRKPASSDTHLGRIIVRGVTLIDT